MEKKIDKLGMAVKILLWMTIAVMIWAGLGSCVSQRIPLNEAKASRKIEKHLNAIKRISQVYPDLVDTISAPVKADVRMDSGQVEAPILKVDTSAVNKALAERDSLVRLYDSLVQVKSTPDVEAQIRSVKTSLKLQAQDLVKVIFKDTIITITKEFPLYIDKDTLNITISAITTVHEGIPNTVFKLGPIQDEIVLFHEYPVFEVYQKLPRMYRYGIFAFSALVLLLIIWRMAKKFVPWV